MHSPRRTLEPQTLMELFTMELNIGAFAQIFLFCLVLLVFSYIVIQRQDAPGPSKLRGPPTLPIIGNLHQIPSTGLFLK